MIGSKSTKAELLAHIAAQDALLINAGREAAVLRQQLSLASSQPQLPLITPATHREYYAYVASQRQAAHAQGHRVTAYKTFNDWVQS